MRLLSNISGNEQHVIGSTSSGGADKHSFAISGFAGGFCASAQTNTSTTQTPITIKLFIWLRIFTLRIKIYSEFVPLFLLDLSRTTNEHELITTGRWWGIFIVDLCRREYIQSPWSSGKHHSTTITTRAIVEFINAWSADGGNSNHRKQQIEEKKISFTHSPQI